MSTYQDLLAKKAALDKQAIEIEKQLNEARKASQVEVVSKIKKMMSDHGLTVEDLFGKTGAVKAKSAIAGRTVAPKYRDQQTGNTWTGRGLTPKWINEAIANGKSLDSFKI